MRLINADKLVEICRKGWKLFGRENEKLKHWVDENDIREQPTVDAIPIEWVKKYIEDNTKVVKNPKYDGWYFSEEPIDYYIKFRPHDIEFMLKAWERENVV